MIKYTVESEDRQMKIAFFIPWLLGLSCLVQIEMTAENLPRKKVTKNEDEKRFVHEVYPLLKSKCFVCHGSNPENIRGGLDLTNRRNMIQNQILIPGQAENSQLYQAITWKDKSLQMPPKENDRLTPYQVELVRQWIDSFAPWPDINRWQILANSERSNKETGVLIKTSGGLTEEWTNRYYQPEDLWAFQPIRRPNLPSNALNSIDEFIHRKLAEFGIMPADKADKLTLIRRATFDLTGLPPTPEAVAAFLSDEGSNAFEKVVDQLLMNPGYGEKFGQQWLDIVRYADTSGFSNDFERPNAWRYRDYVIRSFNEDKPYDQFVREQLAGDEIDPTNPEMLIATGFLRMGPWEQTGMTIALETRQFYLDDVTNAVGETLLSIPLRCARCHDHKFDPIPTKDYYRFQSIFAPLQFADRDVEYLPQENQIGFDVGQKRIQFLLDQAQSDRNTINEKEETAAREWMESRGLTYQEKRKRNKLPIDQKPPRYYGLTYQDLGLQKALHKRIQVLQRQLDRYQPIAFSVYNGPWIEKKHVASRMRIPSELTGDLQTTHILKGGSIYSPGDRVAAGTLSVLPTLGETSLKPTDSQVKNRRVRLADWITHPENPLTTRSIVNRVWQHHFGVGLAGNANNFGKMGKKPTHPELLDWLAQDFIDNGWSIKNLHRQIMLSQTYQRSSYHPQYNLVVQTDPQNQLLSHFQPRRLRAEELRDSMLAVSGELNREIGGLPVFPEINQEVALQPRHVMGSIAPAYQPSATPSERHRRTIYAYRSRGLSNPMLSVFNQPSSDSSCELRITSTVTPQALTLFNSRNSHQRALAMAIRLNQERPKLEQQIERGIQLAWGRNAKVNEVNRCIIFVKQMTKYHKLHLPTPKLPPVSVVRTMFEEMTGEPFTYNETLDVYQDYTPDPQPWTVSPQIRALADFCLLLLNANAFLYIY